MNNSIPIGTIFDPAKADGPVPMFGFVHFLKGLLALNGGRWASNWHLGAHNPDGLPTFSRCEMDWASDEYFDACMAGTVEIVDFPPT